MTSSLKKRLSDGLAQLDLPVDEETIGKLIQFVTLLDKWNKVYNLSAIRDPEQMVDLHLLDSLAVTPFLSGNNFLDVGTGAGLPGIPLALVCPDQHFVLLDSNGKKTRFIQQAVLELGLKNVVIIHSRVEDFHPTELFDAIISRAFASLSDMLAGTAHLAVKGGLLLAMKGRLNEQEQGALPEEVQIEEVIELTVPGVDAERCLVKVRLPA
ncbi:MAG: 16S rRNA (guanine(527)-N(7))-methyltransferase RsmG [Gammaproteobacteria bacterium]|nr:MAG: 16S rRNA (guanine(527)-N(7))-methyltransferase RsmG [Gammaproteobacteria bacterium]